MEPTGDAWRPRLTAALVVIYLCVSLVGYTDYPRVRNERLLDDLERRGLAVWRANNCQVCHQIYGFGGFLGPDLTNLVDDETDDAEFAALLRDGRGRMPALHLSLDDQAAVLAYLRALNGTGRSQPPPLGVRRPVLAWDQYRRLAEEWSQDTGVGLDPSVRRGCEVWTQSRCGACHSAFAVGRRQAPDLSGRALDRSPDALGAILRIGRGAMPSFSLARPEIEDLAAFLAWISEHRAELVDANDRLTGYQPSSWSDLPWFEYR